MTELEPEAFARLAPALPPGEIPLGLSLGEKTLRGFSRAAHSIADRLLISPEPNLPQMLEQAKSNPAQFVSRGRFSGPAGLSARWSAAIEAAYQGREDALIGLLRANAPLVLPDHHFSPGFQTGRAAEDLERLLLKPEASQELLSALACANIPSFPYNGALILSLLALTRLERPLQVIKNLNARVNFALGLDAYWLNPRSELMIALAQAPNLPELARCGLLDARACQRPPFFEPSGNERDACNGAVVFLEAALKSQGPARISPHRAVNVAMMARSFIDRGLVSEDWIAQRLTREASSRPQNEAFHAQVALRTFASPPSPLMARAAFVQAFESRELAQSLPAAPRKPSSSRAL